MSSLYRLVRVFGDARFIPKGRAVHARIITSGRSPDVYSNNHLLGMYVKFNLINDARKVFDAMPDRNVISWSALISAYSQMGMAEEALNCFRLMVSDGFQPNFYTYVGAISACASICDPGIGKEIHARIYRTEADFSTPVSNSLINMYGKCGLLKSARLVFDALLVPNSISWTSILSSYCQFGDNLEGLRLFLLSRRAGATVNEFSCATALGACAVLKDLDVGMQIHSLVLKCGLEIDRFVETGLINLYSKCEQLHLASLVFSEVDQTNTAAWTALIGGHVQQGKGGEAIKLFLKLQSSDLKLSERTLCSVLGAFADTEVTEVGKQLHSLIFKMGFSAFIFVGNAVLDFYSKCGIAEDSLRTFQEMHEHDTISWNALIYGHIRSGDYGEAIETLRDMLFQGYKPNICTYSSILNICANVPAVKWGKQIHCCVIKPALDSSEVVIGSALTDMYAKCGMLNDARKVFDNIFSKNLISWNTMLIGYAQHGLGREALEVYSMMQRNGIKPNDVTFIGILSACAHAGLVEEGVNYYNSMITHHCISPRMEHLSIMVNLFACNGQTRKAYEFIRSFPMEPTKVVWRCLLSGCRTKKDVVLGKYAAEKILSIDPEDTSAHVMLSNIYAEAKMWVEIAHVRKNMKEKAMKKDTGLSWIELKNKIYSFSTSHFIQFQGMDVREVLNQLTIQLFDAGYAPNAMFLFHTED